MAAIEVEEPMPGDLVVYVDSANDATTLIVQIEHIQAVENVDAILDVPGIDGVLVGPFDLSASMGKTGYTDDPAVQAAIQRVLLACRQHSRPAGIFMGDPAGAQWALRQGFTLIACSSEMSQLAAALSGLLGQLKAA